MRRPIMVLLLVVALHSVQMLIHTRDITHLYVSAALSLLLLLVLKLVKTRETSEKNY